MVTRRAKEGGCGRGQGAGARVREEGRRLGGEAGRGASPLPRRSQPPMLALERRAWCLGHLDTPQDDSWDPGQADVGLGSNEGRAGSHTG